MNTFEYSAAFEIKDLNTASESLNTIDKKYEDFFSPENDFSISIVSKNNKSILLNKKNFAERDRVNDYYFNYNLLEYPNGKHLLLISNSDQSINDLVHRPTVINQRKEICKYLFGLPDTKYWLSDFKNNTILRDKILIEIVTRANMQKLLTENPDDVIKEYFLNSQQAYQAISLLSLRNNFQPAVFWVTESNYNQTEHFGWMYGKEASVLEQIIKQKQLGPITVLDEATGFGHFIFTCAHLFSKEQLEKVRFFGTDYKMKDMSIAMQASGKNTSLQARWVVEDIDKEGHFERLLTLNQGEKFDLIVVNHVIEHLNNKSLLDYLTGWMQIANNLIIAVPFEDSLEHTVSSHVHLFDEDSLFSLGQKLAKNLNFKIVVETKFLKGGVIIFNRL